MFSLGKCDSPLLPYICEVLSIDDVARLVLSYLELNQVFDVSKPFLTSNQLLQKDEIVDWRQNFVKIYRRTAYICLDADLCVNHRLNKPRTVAMNDAYYLRALWEVNLASPGPNFVLENISTGEIKRSHIFHHQHPTHVEMSNNRIYCSTKHQLEVYDLSFRLLHTREFVHNDHRLARISAIRVDMVSDTVVLEHDKIKDHDEYVSVMLKTDNMTCKHYHNRGEMLGVYGDIWYSKEVNKKTGTITIYAYDCRFGEMIGKTILQDCTEHTMVEMLKDRIWLRTDSLWQAFKL